jgi:hypothetical protein
LTIASSEYAIEKRLVAANNQPNHSSEPLSDPSIHGT